MRNFNKIDYAGFTFAGIHSSQFGLYSVSSGDRYSRYLSPTIKNLTSDRVGKDGSYYFGYQYTQQIFSFNMAFDSLTELELKELKQWLSSNINYLILDEIPYIEYYVKLQSAPQINFLVFNNNENGKRVYKGEFNINFISYDCFGYSVDKWLDNYTNNSLDIKTNCNNKDEWASSSNLLENNMKNGEPYYDIYNNLLGEIPLYNGGDLEANFILSFSIPENSKNINIYVDSFSDKRINLKVDNSILPSQKIKIDTKKRLVTIDEKVSNNLIDSGDFFLIPKNESKIKLPTDLLNVNIDYKYRYL